MDFQIKSLIDNIKRPLIEYTLDIVLEPGCFNGAYEVGGLMFVRELESRGFFKVGRISASSAGAIAGFLYFTKSLDKFPEIWERLKEGLLEDGTLCRLREILSGLAETLTDSEFESIRSGKLFIAVYNVTKMEQQILDKFATREDLVEAILKSSHFPLLTNGEALLRSGGDDYLDGGMPHIFKARQRNPKQRILYLSITTYRRFVTMFNLSSEITIHGRILEGMLDVYNFFLKERETAMTSFIHDWQWTHFVRLRVWQFAYCSLVYSTIIANKIVSYIYPQIKDSPLFKHYQPLMGNIYTDILLYILFK